MKHIELSISQMLTLLNLNISSCGDVTLLGSRCQQKAPWSPGNVKKQWNVLHPAQTWLLHSQKCNCRSSFLSEIEYTTVLFKFTQSKGAAEVWFPLKCPRARHWTPYWWLYYRLAPVFSRLLLYITLGLLLNYVKNSKENYCFNLY